MFLFSLMWKISGGQLVWLLSESGKGVLCLLLNKALVIFFLSAILINLVHLLL